MGRRTASNRDIAAAGVDGETSGTSDVEKGINDEVRGVFFLSSVGNACERFNISSESHVLYLPCERRYLESKLEKSGGLRARRWF